MLQGEDTGAPPYCGVRGCLWSCRRWRHAHVLPGHSIRQGPCAPLILRNHLWVHLHGLPARVLSIICTLICIHQEGQSKLYGHEVQPCKDWHDLALTPRLTMRASLWVLTGHHGSFFSSWLVSSPGCFCRCTCSPLACCLSAAWLPARPSCATSLRNGRFGHSLWRARSTRTWPISSRRFV